MKGALPQSQASQFDAVDWLISFIPPPPGITAGPPPVGPSDSLKVVFFLSLMLISSICFLIVWRRMTAGQAAGKSTANSGWLNWLSGLNFWDWMGFGKSPTRKHRDNSPYQPKSILTLNEIEFYNRLVSALPEYVVLTQVAMSAFIEPRLDEPREYARRRMKFAQKYVDFIICEPGDLRIICLVELDDVMHDEAKDALRDEMLGSAGYTVVRWHSRKKPDRGTIAKAIRKLDLKK